MRFAAAALALILSQRPLGALPWRREPPHVRLRLVTASPRRVRCRRSRS
jgi:hypothetical protein